MAADPVARDIQIAFAVVGIIRADQPCFQTCRDREGLGDRTRFIGTADAVISPQVGQGLQPFFFREQGKRRLADIVSGQFTGICQQRHAQQGIGIIGIRKVECGIGSHGFNLTVIHIHDDTADVIGAVAVMVIVLVLLSEAFQMLYDNALYVFIDGQDQIVSVPGRYRRPFQAQIVIQIAIDPAFRTVEDIIVVFLQSEGALIGAIGKADDITDQISAGIGTAVAGFEPYPLNIGIISVFFTQILFILFPDPLFQLGIKLLLFRIRQIFSGDEILGRRIFFHIFADSFRVRPQLFQGIQGRFQIILCFIGDNRFGVYDDIIDQLAVCQYGPLTVGDLSSPVGNGFIFVCLLGKYLFGIFLAIVPCDVDQADTETDKTGEDNHKERDQLPLHAHGESLGAAGPVPPGSPPFPFICHCSLLSVSVIQIGDLVYRIPGIARVGHDLTLLGILHSKVINGTVFDLFHIYTVIDLVISLVIGRLQF